MFRKERGSSNGNGTETAAPAHHTPLTSSLNPFGIHFLAWRRVRPGGPGRFRWSSEICEANLRATRTKRVNLSVL
ncbi:MAG: hypothetical protein AUJ52_11910 [Elusimicrobia bacterium CG1_02_63_36]|nr:MAG: hypothetical protein AUJ52_11910 [Elusimicrobia bacterium CG1_02_63_36]PJA12029.1 MAG: hypothetical protein COX66_18305 [Elusimicrobia bacterium CG_4_10_14_0_2_um_filter_63_34]PJB25929.1 MAG: hypothetical protein CO113_06150 [Elusimicrobia bacterium CG_4_9_14_3_um_filter_62_55]